MNSVSVSKTIRTPWNTSGYERIVRGVLGSTYHVSIVLIGDTRARALNNKYRGKTYPANILTFPIAPNMGEIYISIPRVKSEANTFDHTPEQHAQYLLIHGCLHLKGYSHGSTMEKAEDAFMKKFVLR